jgi:DNA-directed RNA polymerase specialized sigma24 family protein
MWLKLCPNKRVSQVMACVMVGMKYYQVAEKLDISLSMVKHDYQRGIEYLKECMVTK